MNYKQKIEEEYENYENVTDVHALPEIYGYWSGKFLLPILLEAGYKSVEDFYLKNILASMKNFEKKLIY